MTSAGYGTVQHALRHGVPMVLSGKYEDKAEIGAMGIWAGVAEYHKKNVVDPDDVRDSVNKILSDDRFKQKAMEIAEIYKGYDPVERMDAILQERIASFHAKTAHGKQPNKDEL